MSNGRSRHRHESSIGEGIASLLLDRVPRVVGVSRAGSRNVLRDRARSADVRHDLSATQRIDEMIEQALRAFGTIDARVNNAGTLISAGCHKQTDAEFDWILVFNLTASFRLSQLIAQHWVADGTRGVIVDVCSVEPKLAWPPPGQSAHTRTKAGLLGLTRGLALALAGDEIRVVAVGPGVFDTDMSISGDLRGRIPLGQPLRHDYRRGRADRVPAVRRRAIHHRRDRLHPRRLRHSMTTRARGG